MSRYDAQLALEGWDWVVGVDEAGRGPLAGPVCVCAILVPVGRSELPDGIDDSKVLRPATREALAAELAASGLVYSLAARSPGAIDRLNILRATLDAMSMAVTRVMACARLPTSDRVLVAIDGNRTPPTLPLTRLHPNLAVQAIVDGDAKSQAIGAASILAKVARDHFMRRMDQRFPGYGFAQHAGYGTKAHMDALRRLGPCPIHRRSFRGVL
jgi:ribonuclease HII